MNILIQGFEEVHGMKPSETELMIVQMCNAICSDEPTPLGPEPDEALRNKDILVSTDEPSNSFSFSEEWGKIQP